MIQRTTLGWLTSHRIETSRQNRSISDLQEREDTLYLVKHNGNMRVVTWSYGYNEFDCSLITHFLMATSCPSHVPLYTLPNDPIISKERIDKMVDNV